METGTQQSLDRAVVSNAVITLVKCCHGDAKAAGWWTDLATNTDLTETKDFNVAEKLMLIVSEVAEAMEGARRDLMDDHLPHRKQIEVELADTLIRITDLAGAMNLDLAGAVAEKLEYNRNRADHKIENRKSDNGKKF